jgi:hypothetical protein
MVPVETKSTPVSATARMVRSSMPPAARPRDRGAGCIQIEVVEQGNVGAPGDRFFELRQGFHLDLQGAVGVQLPGPFDGSPDAARGGNMVFLDQERVEQADPMVVAATAAHRVLLGQAQARNGLTGIEQPGCGAADEIGVAGGPGRGARQQLDEIQHGALGGQQRSCRPPQGEQNLIGLHPITVCHREVHRDGGVELRGGFPYPRRAAEHSWLTRDHPRFGMRIGSDQLGADVAAADVLGQRGSHVGADCLLQVVVELHVGFRVGLV